jgi:hypothetical protein
VLDVENKDALLAGAGALLWAEVERNAVAGDWREASRALVRTLRDLALGSKHCSLRPKELSRAGDGLLGDRAVNQDRVHRRRAQVGLASG